MARIYVVGIGFRPLDPRTREIVLSSEVILTSERLRDVFKMYDEFGAVSDKVTVLGTVDETISFMKAMIQDPAPGSRHMVLLAAGDPLFFGIGKRTVKEFGKDMVEIIPDLSCIQAAFARIKETWDDAVLISFHGGPDKERRRKLEYELGDLPALITSHNKIAILTDRVNTPSAIADTIFRSSELQNFQPASLRLFVCERLGYPDEKVTEGSPGQIAQKTFPDPNVVIIMHTE